MQPQDQNYQSNDQSNPTPPNDDQAISAEQLEPAPSQEDQSAAQPPLAPFIDGAQGQTVDDIPEVPDLSSVPSSNNETEMEHLAEPPSQPISETDASEQLTAPAMDEINDQNDQSMTTSEPTDYNQSNESNEDENSTVESIAVEEPASESDIEVPVTSEPEQPIDSGQDIQADASEVNEPQDTTDQGDSPIENASPEAVPSTEITPDNEPSTATEDANVPETELQSEAPAEPQPPTERVSLTDHGSFEPQEPQSVTNTTVATPEEKENIYTEICSEIIKEQEQIIGTLAVEQANYVEGLTVDPVTFHCIVNGDGSKVIDDLIEQYRDFFGHAAVEVCKEAASRFLARLPAEELPTSLR